MSRDGIYSSGITDYKPSTLWKEGDRGRFAVSAFRQLEIETKDAYRWYGFGKEIIDQTEGQIATAINVGIETYNREKSKAHVC